MNIHEIMSIFIICIVNYFDRNVEITRMCSSFVKTGRRGPEGKTAMAVVCSFLLFIRPLLDVKAQICGC